MTTITPTLVPEDERSEFLPRQLGGPMPAMHFEGQLFTVARNFCKDYGGGMWDFYELDNGGFFMAPAGKDSYRFANPMNYSDVNLSAQAFGVVCTIYAISSLLEGPPTVEQDARIDKLHLLQRYAANHPESPGIFQAID